MSQNLSSPTTTLKNQNKKSIFFKNASVDDFKTVALCLVAPLAMGIWKKTLWDTIFNLAVPRIHCVTRTSLTGRQRCIHLMKGPKKRPMDDPTD